MRKTLTLILLTLLPALDTLAGSDLKCVDLRCEFLTNPTGVERMNPRFSWRVESEVRGQEVSARRILVASTVKKLEANEGDLWDSGKTPASRLRHFKYGGDGTTLESKLPDRTNAKPLHSGQQVFWKVMVWDQAKEMSNWSGPAHFTVGLLEEGDWKAEWISFDDPTPLHRNKQELHLPPPHYYRGTFKTTRKVKRALVHATALGIYDLHLNGERVTGNYFAPGWTDYRRSVYYNSYDVTSRLQEGSNCLGAVVADGWYSGYLPSGKAKGYGPYRTGRNMYGKNPAFLAQLHIEYEDGTSQVVLTDSSWKVTTGPETAADLLAGEQYDARKELAGWSTPGYDASKWNDAIPATKSKSLNPPFSDKTGTRATNLSFIKPGLTTAYPAEPVRVTMELAAKVITEPRPKTYLFDFGQNFSGNVRLTIKGEAGQKITLRYAERLLPNGAFAPVPPQEIQPTDSYICRGDPEGEIWSPRFTYHGFQFVEVSGFKEKPPLSSLTGLVLHNDLRLTSGFECSDPVVNKIYQNAVWTHRANLVELPTKSPRTGDRLAWTADIQLAISGGCYMSDSLAFYAKWLNELQECRSKEGFFTSYAPFPFAQSRSPFAAGWSDSGVICPFVLWRFYGEREIVRSRWFAIERFMAARRKWKPIPAQGPASKFQGDLYHLNDPTPLEFINLCYYGLDIRLMMLMANIHQGPITFLKYKGALSNIIEELNKKYLNPNGSLKLKSQTAHVLALRFGLLNPEQQQQVAKDLVALIRTKRGPAHSGVTTGILGTKELLTVLARNGYPEEAVAIIQSRKFPSLGFGVENGANTIWERGTKADDKDSSLSFAHPVHGTTSNWLISGLAGISAATPGFHAISLEPTIPSKGEEVEPIRWVRAHYDSLHGRITVHWERRKQGGLLYEVTIPADTTAVLKLPAGKGAIVTESGKTPDAAEGVTKIDPGVDDGRAYFQLLSGSYRFEVK